MELILGLYHDLHNHLHHLINSLFQMTDYLAEREQLFHDIECIVESFFHEKYNGDTAESDELTRILCDAVEKNFPTTN